MVYIVKYKHFVERANMLSLPYAEH